MKTNQFLLITLFSLLFYTCTSTNSKSTINENGKNAEEELSNIDNKNEKYAFNETEKSLDDIIVTVIKAYQNEDNAIINKLINQDKGIIFIHNPGASYVLSSEKNFDFNSPTPDYYPYKTKFSVNYKIDFVEELPIFDCEYNKWNKKDGIYCDKKNTTKDFSDVLQDRIDYLGENISSEEINALKSLESETVKIIVIFNNGADDFSFYLSNIDNNWYLTGMDRILHCSA